LIAVLGGAFILSYTRWRQIPDAAFFANKLVNDVEQGGDPGAKSLPLHNKQPLNQEILMNCYEQTHLIMTIFKSDYDFWCPL